MLDNLFTPIHLLVLLTIFSTISVVVVAPYWMIFKKAGFPAFLGVLMVVPLLNIVLLYILAFSRWKVVPAAPNVYPSMNCPPQ